MARGANIPTSAYHLSDGSYTQSGSISSGGSTYSNKLFYPSSKKNFKISYSGTAESKGGKRGEIYLFSVGLYNSQHVMKQLDFHEGDVSLTGKISWDFGTTFKDKMTEFCYLEYTGVKTASTSYDITVS